MTTLLKEVTKPASTTSIKTQVQEILAVMLAFSNLLTRETEALRRSDFKAVDTLQADKRLFAQQYQDKIAALATQREAMLSLDLHTREKLMKERERFNKVLDENMYALDLAQHSTKRLVNRILEAARQAVVDNTQTNYGSHGRAMTYKSASMSINLDSSL